MNIFGPLVWLRTSSLRNICFILLKNICVLHKYWILSKFSNFKFSNQVLFKINFEGWGHFFATHHPPLYFEGGIYRLLIPTRSIQTLCDLFWKKCQWCVFSRPPPLSLTPSPHPPPLTPSPLPHPAIVPMSRCPIHSDSRFFFVPGIAHGSRTQVVQNHVSAF